MVIGSAYGVAANPESLQLADINGDGFVDVLTGSLSTNLVTVYRGSGTGTFSGRLDYAIGITGRSVGVGDLYGTGRMDVIAADPVSNNIAVLKNYGCDP